MPDITITFSSQADTPNIKGHIFPKSILEEAVKKLNNTQLLVHADRDDSGLSSAIGVTKQGTAQLVDGRIQVIINLFKHQVVIDTFKNLPFGLDNFKAGGKWTANIDEGTNTISNASLDGVLIEPIRNNKEPLFNVGDISHYIKKESDHG